MFREVSVAMVNPSMARDPEQICEQLTVTQCLMRLLGLWMIFEVCLLPERMTMVFLQKSSSFYIEIINFCLLQTSSFSSIWRG